MKRDLRKQAWDELRAAYPGAQLSWGVTAWDREDALPEEEFWACPMTIWVWDKAKYEKDLAEYARRVKEVEDWAGTRAFPHGVIAPNGMKGKVLWAGAEGVPRFYPEEYPPNWVNYVLDSREE
jgi:hypothetical protein